MGGSCPPRLLALLSTRTQHILGHPAPCQELELHDICRLNRPPWQAPHPTLSPRPAPCFIANLWENVGFLKIFSETSPPSHLNSGFFLAPGTPRLGLGSKDLKFHVYTSLLYLRKEISSRCLPPVRTGPVTKDTRTSAASLSWVHAQASLRQDYPALQEPPVPGSYLLPFEPRG